MNSNTRRTDSSPTAAAARSVGRLTAAGLALAAPLAIAGAVLSGPAANATTVPSYAMSLSTHALAFGSVNIGSHLAKSVTVLNGGSTSLQPVQILSGSKEFKVGGSCVNATLAPGASCKYTVRFAPSAAGAVTGTLQVLSVQGTPAQSVALSGTGVVQQMQAYTFWYSYTNPPVQNNGVAVPQSYAGTGFAPAGMYTQGQTIPVYDSTRLTLIGTYQIIAVAADEPLNPSQANTVTVTQYYYGDETNNTADTYTTSNGLSVTTATSGLGSESGALDGYGFNDQRPALYPMHW